MIVRSTEHEIVLTKQHDHARLAGDIATHFGHFFVSDPRFEDALVAVYQHDLGWVRLDETPLWNDRKSIPFSFMDYPLLPKLTHYTFGLDQVENMNPYAALLCSMHYSSFAIFQNSDVKACIEFSQHEILRQQRIRSELNLSNHEDLKKQLHLLQLCDQISLYVCLNEPGVLKKEENPRYKAGFSQFELFTAKGHGQLVAEWISDTEIRITPNPFEKTFRMQLIQKKLKKSLIEQYGIAEAYANSEWVIQEVVFMGQS